MKHASARIINQTAPLVWGRGGIDGIPIDVPGRSTAASMTNAAGADDEPRICYTIVEYSRIVQAAAPVIAWTLRTLSNLRVRNIATVGGYLAHAE